ncbi:hypothetical protein H0H92_007359 [Tricholoma furcatifolium]|nr:hypothetical protein H0H92_007359 [Tricholoma furcatifolium]
MAIFLNLLHNFTASSPLTPIQARRLISQDTIARSETIIGDHKTEGATADSEFLSLDQLPPLDSSDPEFPNCGSPRVRLLNSDSFTAARDIFDNAVDAFSKTTVLNLASDEFPAGGWVTTLTKTQEEALCYSSTLYATLKHSYYPWANTGPGSAVGIYSPGVVIFKDDLDHNCVDLLPGQRRVVSVITVAAPRRRPLTSDGLTFRDSTVLEDLRNKIRLVYRMAARRGKTYLVLGALGCGAYRCPPALVANEMKAILEDDEFKGWFKEVVFAIYAAGEIGRKNLEIFSGVFGGNDS